MCGITGYIGRENCTEHLLKGLTRLEYRGYDSAGISVYGNGSVRTFKQKGRIDDLKALLPSPLYGNLGIGHTRWATHGEPNQKNAHPHSSSSGRYTLVHNGVIENYEELQSKWLQNAPLTSSTDTEVIVQMIETLSLTGLSTKEAFIFTLSELKGSYAIAMIDRDAPDELWVAKNKSPLLIGLGDTFMSVVSDAIASIHATNQYIELKDEEIVRLTSSSASIETLQGEEIKRKPFKASIDDSDIEKGPYMHYMLKEIDEQPAVIRSLISHYSDGKGEIDISSSAKECLLKADRIHIVACGTSYHAGLVGKEYLEKIAGIPTEVHIASEFVYNTPLLGSHPVFLYLSQSGETADSRAVLVEMKKLGYPSITITNAKGSTLSRESDHTLLLHAGPEIAVASTKAYTAQIAVLYLVAKSLMKTTRDSSIKDLSRVAQSMEAIIDHKENYQALAKHYLLESRNAFFIGRAMDYHVCLEGALKLKEISYIQSEGFAGGELKHGTIALIEEGTPVIALTTQTGTDPNIRNNAKEVLSRGAHVLFISTENTKKEGDQNVIPSCPELLSPLLSVIPLQLLAYYAALEKGCDVDKPRNLAKSVTVE
ncbi:glutamine--fructose-6-phosphate transaminase (isomerizing) (plasmid) [Pontibacillus sp. ALD_SL1]|uniref:glutamine--fructose-6-phosphate transaminase (isomerizing) n=1 Tax=Pontibacillus sp. ALD_SL1 TaxID=2777185 RepID=UPI001A96A091|nr:glutamine--fructose-6-phosphate transaminase (isomerizing) [Pontibacillus sp. ALD_SL1]QST02057.1 glutamine--fructose-6-phosphate transaminase (isomerizing) [Pontibacillus sp. ALD_SL1]